MSSEDTNNVTVIVDRLTMTYVSTKVIKILGFGVSLQRVPNILLLVGKTTYINFCLTGKRETF